MAAADAHSSAKRTSDFFGIQEVDKIGLHKVVPELLRGDIDDGQEERLGFSQRVLPRLQQPWVQRQNRGARRLCLQPKRRTSDTQPSRCVSDASSKASGSRAGFLALQRLRTRRLRTVREQPDAPCELRWVPTMATGRTNPTHVPEPCRVTLVIERLQHGKDP